MVATVEDICNIALGHLRQGKISSINANTPAAEACKQFYSVAIDNALRGFDWPFARAYQAGVLITDPTWLPRRKWTYGYEFPDEGLAIRGLDDGDEGYLPFQYEITLDMRTADALVIQTNEVAPVFIYTRRITALALYDPSFVLAASYHLVTRRAMPLTGKLNIADAMRKLGSAASAEAMAQSANEETIDFQDEHTPDWIAARGGWIR